MKLPSKINWTRLVAHAFLFAMYWALFGFVANWWLGALAATVLFAAQYLVQRALSNVELEES